jgi:hypothetical protein
MHTQALETFGGDIPRLLMRIRGGSRLDTRSLQSIPISRTELTTSSHCAFGTHLRGKPCNSRAKLTGESLKAEKNAVREDKSPHTAKPTHTHQHIARTLKNQHGSHWQRRRNDATELAHADMTALPKTDTNCTALSLIPTITGNTFAASLRTDICPQRKESSSTSHARNPFNLNFFVGSVSDGPEVALNWLFPYPI